MPGPTQDFYDGFPDDKDWNDFLEKFRLAYSLADHAKARMDRRQLDPWPQINLPEDPTPQQVFESVIVEELNRTRRDNHVLATGQQAIMDTHHVILSKMRELWDDHLHLWQKNQNMEIEIEKLKNERKPKVDRGRTPSSNK